MIVSCGVWYSMPRSLGIAGSVLVGPGREW